jgi:hypothetical protein
MFQEMVVSRPLGPLLRRLPPFLLALIALLCIAIRRWQSLIRYSGFARLRLHVE